MLSNKSLCADSTFNLDWSTSFGGSDYDSAYQVIETSDGGYVIIGTYEYYGSEERDAWIIKTNENSLELWERKIGEPGFYEDGYSIAEASDGDLIICGITTEGDESYDLDGFLFKTDSGGGSGLKYTFGQSAVQDYFNKVIESNDGHFVVVGSTNGKLWLVNVEPTWCNIDWEKSFNTVNHGYDIQQTADNGYIILGINSENQICLIKTNSNGEEQWMKTLTDEGTHYTISLDVTSDGGYIVSGWVTTTDTSGYDALLIKTDDVGQIEWTKTYGGSDYEDCYDVIQTDDGGYLLACNSKSYVDSYKIPLLIKTDSNGVKEWEKTFGGQPYDSLTSLIESSDNDYILTGQTGDIEIPYADVWLLKFTGDSLPIENESVPTIDNLVDNQEINGTIKIRGTASLDELEYTVIQIDEGHWLHVGGRDSWSYTLNTTELSNGLHSFSVKSYFEGGVFSSIVTVSFLVNNEIDSNLAKLTLEFLMPTEEGMTVFDSTYISGKAYNTEYRILEVELMYDNEPWHKVEDTKRFGNMTTFNDHWNMRDLDLGKHTIYARCTNGDVFSDVYSINVTLKERTSGNIDSTSTPGFEMIFLITCIFLIVVNKRKNHNY